MPNNKHIKQEARSNTSSSTESTSTGEMDNYQVRTLQKKRTTNFREDETKLLISLWGSPVIQNKLYLTHRKAPVMRLLAANMQQRGFYRSPDEIKTRIRNLKCLYHRIKRTMVTGSGIGTVDPDWPHFKAMDAILGKENKQDKNRVAVANAMASNNSTTANVIAKEETPSENTSLLEGPRCEDIKQEVDIDINDDMESWNGNDSLGGGSDFEESQIPATSIVKTPLQMPTQDSLPHIIQSQNNQQKQQQITTHLPTILPNITIPTGTRSNGAIPLPLLILNHGIPSQPIAQNDKRIDSNATKGNNENLTNIITDNTPPDLVNILREILSVQNQQLELEKQKFELEKQRLEFDRVVGSQLMTLVPMVGGLLQRLVYPAVASTGGVGVQHSSPEQHSVVDAADSAISCDDNEAESKDQDADKPLSDYDILKDSKILRTVLERGIKKYMMADETRASSNKQRGDNHDDDDDQDEDEDSDNDDSGINENHLLIDQDNNSNTSSK